MLRARDVLRTEVNSLHRQVLALVRADEVCRRLMTVPGVGALTALTFKSAVDDPARFTSSKAVGAHFGLTPKKYQSGETDVTGAISKVGDAMARGALYEAAQVMLTRAMRCRPASLPAKQSGLTGFTPMPDLVGVWVQILTHQRLRFNARWRTGSTLALGRLLVGERRRQAAADFFDPATQLVKLRSLGRAGKDALDPGNALALRLQHADDAVERVEQLGFFLWRHRSPH